MSDIIAYFGYGSLVNKQTHRTPTRRMIPARLKGWRRGWFIRGQAAWAEAGGVCALTAEPDAASAIDGALILDHVDSLPAVDEREMRYNRHQLTADMLESPEALPDIPLYVYSAKDAFRGYGDEDCPVIRSYVDAVLQGYMTLFGQSGLERFMTETFGWHVPILDDRNAPRYPRAVTVTEEEQKLFDRLIQKATAG
ncbi:gamma-glutamylcyclotransferase family protein [Coralliovum pocilloporae]|uniref:gamma-glutamylcyclotransferase family protein n=1 Tax=Coralliovum pocilloporae TaxID=3066369 RepID=UPI00330763A0